MRERALAPIPTWPSDGWQYATVAGTLAAAWPASEQLLRSCLVDARASDRAYLQQTQPELAWLTAVGIYATVQFRAPADAALLPTRRAAEGQGGTTTSDADPHRAAEGKGGSTADFDPPRTKAE